MPSKSHRAASRQARLSRRKRRGKPALQNFQAGPSQPTTVAEPDDASPRPASRPATATAVATQSRATAPSPARAAARSRRRAIQSGAESTRYLGRELRQIGFITAFIALILAALTFVLG